MALFEVGRIRLNTDCDRVHPLTAFLSIAFICLPSAPRSGAPTQAFRPRMMLQFGVTSACGLEQVALHLEEVALRRPFLHTPSRWIGRHPCPAGLPLTIRAMV